MVVRELGLIRFRNYENLFTGFADRLNVFFGKNGQGKTNLLEAIYLVTHLESFRTRKIVPLIERPHDLSQVQAVIVKDDRDWKTRIDLTRQGKKVWLDDTSVSKVSYYIALFFSLVFNGDFLYQFRQFPAERRAFFDRYLSFIDPGYLMGIKDMRVILSQKNKLLKTGDSGSLSDWNHLLIEKGYAIIAKRREAIEAICEELERIFPRVSGRRGRLEIAYRPSLDGPPEAWAEALARAEPRERQLGHALVGPHRDDFRLRLDDGRQDDHFSQGEFRICFLALLLSMNAWLDSIRKVRPVLILDDLFSELDRGVQKTLMSFLAGLPNQIFVTTTEWTEGFCPSDAAVREIRRGRIV